MRPNKHNPDKIRLCIDMRPNKHNPDKIRLCIDMRPNKHNPDKIRLCIDMRQANKAIEGIRHPIPSTDDLIHDLNETKFFCKLDFNSAFLQFEPEESSRYITTFSTHQRLHRFKVLNYGTASASEELNLFSKDGVRYSKEKSKMYK